MSGARSRRPPLKRKARKLGCRESRDWAFVIRKPPNTKNLTPNTRHHPINPTNPMNSRTPMNPMNPKNPRKRLDQRLVDEVLVESRERARGLILAGQVRVDGRRVDKPGTLIGSEAAVTIAGPEHPFVGRGGVKLRAAPEAFGVDGSEKGCLEGGARARGAVRSPLGG